MEEQAHLSSRVCKPCYHISLTLPQTDIHNFSSDDWRELTKYFVERMELDDRQAIAYLHDDATYPDGNPRPHVHLVVNRVGDDGRCIRTSWDYYRAQSALRETEKHFGLTREPSSWEVDRRRDPPDQVQRRQDANPLVPPTIRTQLQNSIDHAIDRVGSLDGVADFMQNLGVDVRVSDRGWSLKHERVAFQGSKLGRAYSAPAVKQRIAMSQSQPIGDMLRESAETDRQEDRQRNAQNERRAGSLDGFGHRLMREDGGEIDGLSVIGAGLQATAAGMKAIDAIQDAIANSRDESRRERLEETLERMKSLGERTGQLESRLTADDERTRNDRITDIANRTERLERAGESDRTDGLNTQAEPHDGDRTDTGFERPVGAPEPDPVVESLMGLDKRIGSMEGESQSEQPQKIQLDREMSFDEQLDAVDALLDNLEERLDALEERAFGMRGVENQAAQRPQPEPEPAEPEPTEPAIESAPKLGSAELAKQLSRYVESRAEVYQIPTSGKIPTRTLGEIAADYGGDDATLSIRDDDYGTKFEAVRIDDRDRWEVITDELNDSERESLSDLPQSADEYVERANGKAVVRSLRTLAGHEFGKPEGGGVRMPSGEGFDYLVRISPPDDDGAHQITGARSDSGDTILQAELKGGTATVEQSDIPTDFVDALAAQAGKARQRRKQRAQSRNRDREAER